MAFLTARAAASPEGPGSSTRTDQVRQIDLPLLYERIRLRGSTIGVAVTLCVGTLTGWPNGPWVPVSAATILVHALMVKRSGRRPGSMTLVIDGAAIATATLTMGIPVVTATGLCFYAVVASVLTSGRRAVAVALYTGLWVGMSLLWSYGGFKAPYEPESRVVIELTAVIFFAIVISVIVATVMLQLRRTDEARSAAALALQESNSQLEDMIEAKDRFVASVSHELRTPLTAVIGLAQELNTPTTSLGASELAEFHQMIAGEAEEVARIVEDLLVAARADIGEVAVFPTNLDLGELVAETIRATAGTAALQLSVTGEAAAIGDSVRVKQIVRNLVVNAIRYGGSTVLIELGQESGVARIDVLDNGGGVPDADAGQIFDAYQSAHAPRREVQSIGLGLSVSRTLAQLMDGELAYERRGDWSVFSLSLPASS